MTKLEVLIAALQEKNIRFEKQEIRSDEFGEKVLVGILFREKSWVWNWFCYEKFMSGEEFLSLDHTYSQNNGKAKKGIMDRIKAHDRLKKATGIDVYKS